MKVHCEGTAHKDRDIRDSFKFADRTFRLFSTTWCYQNHWRSILRSDSGWLLHAIDEDGMLRSIEGYPKLEENQLLFYLADAFKKHDGADALCTDSVEGYLLYLLIASLRLLYRPH